MPAQPVPMKKRSSAGGPISRLLGHGGKALSLPSGPMNVLMIADVDSLGIELLGDVPPEIQRSPDLGGAVL